jgi:ribosomal protein L20
MKQTKGFFGDVKNVWTVAKNASRESNAAAYRDRNE